MALKSPTERINDLETLVTLLNDRLDAVRKELEGGTLDRAELRKEFGDLKTQIALLGKACEDLKQWKDEVKRLGEERGRKLWMIVPPLLAAILTGAISFILHLIFRKP